MDPNFYAPLSSRMSMPERWESLKPTIARLYVDENRKLEEVKKILRDQYGFDAGIHQLKYHIRLWKVKKNIPTSAKTKMFEMKEARASKGKVTVFEYKGRPVDNSRLARLARSQVSKSLGGAKKKASRPLKASHEVLDLKIAPRIFMKWNMPYGALRYSQTGPINYVSPNAIASTPAGNSDVIARTPAAQGPLSPPADSPSGLSRALRNKTTLERASCSWRGNTKSFLDQWKRRNKSFNLRTWNAGRTRSKPWSRTTPSPPSQWLMDGITPSILCNWGVHMPGMTYEHAPSPDSEDSDDESERKEWPRSWKRDSFVEKLRRGLANNFFSDIDANDLPIALPRLLQNFEPSRDQLLEEGLAFSVMGRNVDLMFSLARKIKRHGVSIEGLYPFHLATTYLCGSYPCCNVFCGLLYRPRTFPLRKWYVNERGHTVLDNLMVAIIKAHTSCVPGDVDENMRRQRRFAGEEVDICGRWDADSDEMRALLSKGKSRVPIEWKHKFCHTSVQVICHCISLMFGAEWRPDINHPSGLFKKRCQHCPRELTLLPLHTLVLVAFQLAQQGCAEEDLFGIIACLLCLLWKGANPLLAKELSPTVLFGIDRNVCCTHELLSPLQLAERVPRSCLRSWTPAVCTGWSLLVQVLRLSQKAWRPNGDRNTSPTVDFERYITFPDDEGTDAMDIDRIEDAMDIDRDDMDDESVDEDIRHCYDCGDTNYFKGSHELRDLWAATQAEILTYRRLHDGDSWLSQNFIMHEVLENLEGGHGVRVGLIESELLRSYCDCGTFVNAHDEDCACVDEVCSEYFSNLEEWERTTVLHCPEKWRYSEEVEEEEYDYYSEEEEDFDEEEEEGGNDDL